MLEGQWLYDATVRSRVVIVRRDIWYGSGDYEDPPEVAHDQDVETFEILYASPGNPELFQAGGGQFRTLAEAQRAAELTCGPTLAWHPNVRGEADA